MTGFIFGGFGAFIRWIFVFRCNSKKMGDAYNLNPLMEGGKNKSVGFLCLIPLSIVIGLLVGYFDGK